MPDAVTRSKLPSYLASSEAVLELLASTLESFTHDGIGPVEEPQEEVKPPLDRFLECPSTMRDGILILLAYAVASGAPLDFTHLPKFPGGRAVSRHFADEILPSLHIAGKKDALQTGVKGTTTYYDRENPTWREILAWASMQKTIEPIEHAFRYLAAGVAATARDLPSQPRLDTPLLTFNRVFGILDQMLNEPSDGAYQQFAFAALLESHLNQLGRPGHISTKNIFASDTSAGTAADVQHKQGGQVLDAYEVTAADWRSKLKQAHTALKLYDLRRIYILGADVAQAGGDDIAGELAGELDIIVLELREEIRSLVARLDKPHRREALGRLYDHLVEKQSDDALVHAYVDILVARGLTEQG
ncbi:MAG TPA: hypothetical protein VGP18_03695 [Solirubrobacteraceae bacterium]|jgi:hypothetical protein|nr:hypothetical protein [Solirubrobacteraceae bacterium]